MKIATRRGFGATPEVQSFIFDDLSILGKLVGFPRRYLLSTGGRIFPPVALWLPSLEYQRGYCNGRKAMNTDELYLPTRKNPRIRTRSTMVVKGRHSSDLTAIMSSSIRAPGELRLLTQTMVLAGFQSPKYSFITLSHRIQPSGPE